MWLAACMIDGERNITRRKRLEASRPAHAESLRSLHRNRHHAVPVEINMRVLQRRSGTAEIWIRKIFRRQAASMPVFIGKNAARDNHRQLRHQRCPLREKHLWALVRKLRLQSR